MAEQVTPEKPRRITTRDWFDLLARKPTELSSSVELVRNAKGDTQIEVTVRGVDVLEAEKQCAEVYDRLRATYPLATTVNGK